MQVFDLPVRNISRLDLVGEHARYAFNRLPLSFSH